jgi:ectoine hydroxylase-related dioxygenase (phytanoyl-CoA dioxygenase family)
VPEVFSPEEVRAMIGAVEGGGRVAQKAFDMADTSGKNARLALWSELGDDIWASASTHPGIVNTARMLLREEISFFHGKVILKEARSGGAWEWHQDYGYWHHDGFLFPHMLSAFVALDASTKENGCLQVLRSSHHLGRLEHGRAGGQMGTDPERIAAIEKKLERVHVEMTPGSVLFFHCNTLHTSAANESDHHRRSFIVCYTATANPQYRGESFQTYPVCPTSPPDALARFV